MIQNLTISLLNTILNNFLFTKNRIKFLLILFPTFFEINKITIFISQTNYNFEFPQQLRTITTDIKR